MTKIKNIYESSIRNNHDNPENPANHGSDNFQKNHIFEKNLILATAQESMTRL